MAQHPDLELQVAYLSLQGAKAGYDKGFGVDVAWDIPLLDGYKWIELPNKSLNPRLNDFWGLINPQLWDLIKSGNFDVIMCYTGYAYASFWIAVAACKKFKIPLIFGTDSSNIKPRTGGWKVKLKQVILPKLFNLADIIIVGSTPGKNLLQSIGIDENKIVITPFIVNNDWWLEQATKIDKGLVRKEWNIPENALVTLYVAKLQPWKRPQDLLQAFAKLEQKNTYLIYAGDGILKQDLENQAQQLGITNRVKFLGFINQSQLPFVYCGADVLVLPSEYEPFGVVVNEAMLCGCVVITSDRVGAHHDLIREGENGFVYPCGDTEALANILNQLFADFNKLNTMKKSAVKRMETWSPRDNVEAVVKAIKNAINLSN
jgi:glycosyltransferase involved in cell wall biosynthesis